ncbi:hypothetical protein RN11_2916 [Mycobacterium tuberculosis]|nr:hypothetical protein RN11_2916 [Mycobacterium tuberculosis]
MDASKHGPLTGGDGGVGGNGAKAAAAGGDGGQGGDGGNAGLFGTAEPVVMGPTAPLPKLSAVMAGRWGWRQGR